MNKEEFLKINEKRARKYDNWAAMSSLVSLIGVFILSFKYDLWLSLPIVVYVGFQFIRQKYSDLAERIRESVFDVKNMKDEQ